MAAEASYWMDRVRTAQPEAKRPQPRLTLVSVQQQESRGLITARSALLARKGLTQEELHALARSRRQDQLQAVRSKRVLLATGLLAAGVAAALIGSAITSQALVMAGFGLALCGVVAACLVVAAMLEAPLGELGRYLQADEAPATAEEIIALSRASQADPELDHLINRWWRENGAPIRRGDLALVEAFQLAKQNA